MTPRALLALAAACAIAAAAPLDGQTFVNPTLTSPDRPLAIPSSAAALERLSPPPAPVGDTLGLPVGETLAFSGLPLLERLSLSVDPAETSYIRELIAYQQDVAARVSEWEAHAEWANENRDQFRLAMKEWTTDPGKAVRLAAEGDSASKAVELAAIAANPLDARRVREGVPSEAAVDLLSAQRTLRELYEDARDQSRGWPIVIFATGTATDALGKPGDASDDGQSAITTGSLGATVQTNVSRWTARVSVISSDAIAPSDFGPLILTPGAGASLSSGVLDWRGLRHWGSWKMSLLPNHIYGTASRIHLNGGTEAAPRAIRATVIGAGALWARDIFDGPLVESTKASLSIEGGVAIRWMSGDATRDSALEPIFRDVRAFAGGPELGFAFTFGRVTAATQIYHLFNNRDDVPGLGGLQMVAGLSVTGEFLSARLPHRDRP